MSKTMSLPSCSTGVKGTMLGGCLIGGSGPSICAELGLGNRRIPTARADPMMNRAPENDRDTCIITIPISKDVWSVSPRARGRNSTSCLARLGAQAGGAQPGARDEQVHRQDDPAMPVGRVGTTTAARSGHRSARGLARKTQLVTTRGARRTGPLPPGDLRNHRRMNEIVGTIKEARSRVRNWSRRLFATY